MAEERYNEAHGRKRRIIEKTFGLLKARFRCLHLTGGALCYSPKKVCQITVACCMLHNLALRCQVPFLQEEEAGVGRVAVVDPVDSEDEEAEDEDDNRSVLEQSAVDPWKKSKREVQRNSGELLHLLPGEKPRGETLNSPQRRIGYRERKTNTSNATKVDFRTRVPVEQEDQVQESRQSREWADAQEMPAEGAKKLPPDGRSCGFCKNKED
ncbi:hypothetical protein NDU88_007608 [Pleurodeles waltl]|uniref:DDE Tnp4 domain-containing protein n=1 Tax=Pleurodeles waltl TaxID=8319 RepID=A0AAV7RVD0_PLEWA|nr:hypothetical protein NDU88_007608 [Pleurodeles waltl]